jgi:hypothetical protein
VASNVQRADAATYRTTAIGQSSQPPLTLPRMATAGRVASAVVRSRDHQKASSKALARPATPRAWVRHKLGLEEHGKDRGAEGAAHLLHDPVGAAGVWHLRGLEPEVGGGHEGEGHRHQAGTADGETGAEAIGALARLSF